MTKKEILEYCLTFPNVYEDYPFDNVTTVMKHGSNKKMFALIADNQINLKCEPLRSDILRSEYKGIIPGYHMNKQHWNSVCFDTDVPDELILDLVEISYNLTKGKVPKKKVDKNVQ